ncbi:MAG: hypothetical protein KF833_11710 [Verrucomicrobiae bacterium]|nr:hypothetical protein [Verrucomicrobiae bacterium]
MKHRTPSHSRFHSALPRRSPFAGAAAAGTLLAVPLAVSAQNQSLSFTGGVLLNTQVHFRHLGSHVSASQPGPDSGSAVNRTYDDGYNRVDAAGNEDGTTAHWGYRNSAQIRPDGMAFHAATDPATVSASNVGDFISPSANLEYRGSLGPVGTADWGVLLGFGYHSVGGTFRTAVSTPVTILQDLYSFADTDPASLPPPPYSGLADSPGPRLGSVPARSTRLDPAGRFLEGTWELETDLFPITGGVYLEAQLAGRLNGVASAGMLALLVSGNHRYSERSTVDPLPPVTAGARHSFSDFLIGGFVQLGLDWALWERASLVASARWQPAQKFHHRANGREAEIDFTTSFAVHAGFSMRF